MWGGVREVLPSEEAACPPGAESKEVTADEMALPAVADASGFQRFGEPDARLPKLVPLLPLHCQLLERLPFSGAKELASSVGGRLQSAYEESCRLSRSQGGTSPWAAECQENCGVLRGIRVQDRNRKRAAGDAIFERQGAGSRDVIGSRHGGAAVGGVMDIDQASTTARAGYGDGGEVSICRGFEVVRNKAKGTGLGGGQGHFAFSDQRAAAGDHGGSTA